MNTYVFDKGTIEAWKQEKDLAYAIPDPGDNLIEIYEIDTMKDALLLRAEKWESPEHIYVPVPTPGSDAKKPLNVQNPNYTELLELIRSLQKQSGDLKKNKKDLKGLKDDLIAINKKTTAIEEISQKLLKSWNNFMNFVTKIVSIMTPTPTLTTSTTAGIVGTARPVAIELYKLDPIPDIRLLRFMLSKKTASIDLEIISLICSYLRAKYVDS